MIQKGKKMISFLGCTVQLYLVCTCVVSNVILLAVMAHDRFVANGHPRLYMVVRSSAWDR